MRFWQQDQVQQNNFVCIADLHAATGLCSTPSLGLAERTFQTAALCLACGVDPALTTLFVQSHVSAHSELAWILSCITPKGWLERMTQYKEKGTTASDQTVAAVLYYPLLMASDVLAYKAHKVRIGKDQMQHMQLVRALSRRLSEYTSQKAHGTPWMPCPAALLDDVPWTVKSLTNGLHKMSKSSSNDFSRVNLLDPPDAIRQKIRKCKTDDGRLADASPERENLLWLFKALSGLPVKEIYANYKDMAWSAFKPLLAEAIVDSLRPIQQKYRHLISDGTFIRSTLEEGRHKASIVAERTLQELRDALGFVPKV
eukprot:GHVQ01023458.1.p1 GENE.GHVQ01023458.1~~GHVQ01023458.1.p1  ORF type:complete len:313 (+),score=35.94 GHVQ01023458.1:425-1363(+)